MTELKALARLLWRHRFSSAAAVAVLTVSIAGATATFALGDAVLWRALPYRDSARLMTLVTTHAAGRDNVSMPDFTAIRARVEGADVAASAGFTPEYALSGFGEARQLRGRLLTGRYFDTLGVAMASGREFTEADERVGAGSLAIVTDSLRQQLFGSRTAVGQILSLNGRPHTIVGVLPPFRDPFGAVDLYVPHQFSPTLPRRLRIMVPLVRLWPGRSLTELRTQLRVATATTDPEAAGYAIEAIPLADHLSTATRQSVQLLFGAGAGLLLIGLLNFAMLVAARARDRQPEFALRAALGATRLHILKLTVLDGAALSLAGVAAALVVAQALIPILRAQYEAGIVNRVAIDARVLAFALSAAVLAILTAIGASRAEAPLAQRRAATRSRLTSGRVLIVAQIAVSLALVISATALVRGFLELRRVDPGFRTADMHASRLALPAVRYDTPAKRAQFWRTLLDRLSMQGVHGAISTELPLTGEDNPTVFTAQLSDGAAVATKLRAISPTYFDVMRIPLRAGRFLSDKDTAEAPGVVVINERLAASLSRLGPPIGQTISFGVAATPLVVQVIGVVGDIRHEGLHRAPAPEAYAAFEQTPLTTFSLVLHSERSGADVARLLRATLDGVDRGQPFRAPVLMSDHVERSLSGSRFQAEVLSFFAWSALLAAAAGLYGLLMYMVRNSRREWAIRLALGASGGDLRWHVLRATGQYAACGIAIGLGLFAAASRPLQAIVFGISTWNPTAVAAGVLVLGSVCLGAATIPAWRAGRTAPADVLRE